MSIPTIIARRRPGDSGRIPALLALSSLTSILAATGRSSAATCDPPNDVSGCCYNYPNPVLIAGTSAARTALQTIAHYRPEISIIFGTPDSCIALSDLVSRTGAIQTSNCSPNPGPIVSYEYLGKDGTSMTSCVLSPDAATNPSLYGEAVDIAVSDTFPSTCQNNTAMGGIGPAQIDVLGPIQAQAIAVPSTSDQNSISADAAYVVFGFGGASYVVPPWGSSNNIFIRPYTSGTLNVIGQAIGLPATQWENSLSCLGQVQATSLNMYEAIATGDSESAIGILASQFVRLYNMEQVIGGGVDASTDAGGSAIEPVKTLGFQAPGQTCGYLPDSSQGTGDKLNVRTGRYPIWGPSHLVTNIDANGNPDSSNGHGAAIAAVLNAFIATGCEGPLCPPGNNGNLLGVASQDGGVNIEPDPEMELGMIQAEAAYTGGVVPWCAMNVARGSELGPELPYQSSAPCGCAFEKWATPGKTVSTYCRACPNGDSDCNGTPYPVCRYGYCEAR